MAELIFSIIFIVSFGGVLFILARKIPVLMTLSQNGNTGFRKHHIVLDIENRIKSIFIYFEKQIFLHKFLSWVKCRILKIECGIDNKLHNIRRKAQEVDRDLKERK
jgi:hypothetical protein